MVRFLVKSLFLLSLISVSYANFVAYNDCIRSSGDTTAANVTDWSLYNGYTANTTGNLIDYATGTQTPVTVTFTWNSSAGLGTCLYCGAADSESQPRPGTPAYEVFGGIVDFYDTVQYGNSGWWVDITFTGLNPSKNYNFVGTAIRGRVYTDRLTLFTLSGHVSANNNSSDGIYLKDGNQTVLAAGGNHTNMTGYVVRWDNIVVADQGNGTGSFTIRAQEYDTSTEYRGYPFGGFMLEEIGNAAPTVDAGQDQILYQPKEYLTLSGSAADDGKGSPEGYLQSTWSCISGPSAIEFITDIHQSQVTARFLLDGDYQLRLTATDGQLTSYDDVMVTVRQPLCPAGDMDSDCRVEMADLNALALIWLGDISSGDLNGDGIVNTDEINLLAQSWLEDWTGSVLVTIQPAQAAWAGAQWRLNGGPWQASGATLSGIPEGTHQVEYSDVSHWAKPDTQNVTVTRQQTTAAAGQYFVSPEVVISEFMAVNSNVSDLRPLPSVNVYTQVQGQPAYEDWIELRNTTGSAISLDGWYLTDNPDNLTKWRFPSGYTIPAGGFLVVYASNKDAEKYGYPFVDDLGSLHTNFELSSGGEYLALVRPDGLWIEYEYNDYPTQRGLVTYGIGSDGQVGYLSTVTRGAVNGGIYEGLVEDTKFSADRGFYDAPFTVTLSCPTPDAVIRYTTDTSEPTAATGTIYSGPISITTTTCLRAAAFKTNYLASNVDTQTYIFLDHVLTQATNPATGAQVVPAGYPTQWISSKNGATVTGDYQVDPDIVSSSGLYGSLYAGTIKNDLMAIPSISIVVPINQLFGTATGIYMEESQDGTERVGSAELIDPNGIEKWHINCGVQMQGGVGGGGTTLDRWKCYKLSLRLQFRAILGGDLEFPLFGEGAAGSFDTIILDSRPQNSWVHADSIQRTHGELVRDQVSSNTQLALGGYACHGRPLHVYLNGLYWGVYWMHERPDENFAASYLGGDKDDYDVLKHNYNNVVSGDNADYIAMFNLSATSPDTITAFNNLKQKLDVADFIDYLLANYYLGNGDWDNKNWYASRNRFDPAGRWRWHMWDGEHVMDDGTSLAVVDATTKNNSMAPTGLNQKWIANNPEYRLLFGDRVHKHFFHNGTFMPQNFAALFTDLTNQIDRAIVGESARWGDNRRASNPYTRNNEWITEVNRLLTTFIPTRRDVVFAQFTGKSTPWYPIITAPEFYINGIAQYGGDVNSGASLTASTGGNTVWYTLDGSDPRLPGGAISPAALGYGSAIPLSKSVVINARARTPGWAWSALADVVFDVGPVLESLRVTELMYHPVDPNFEFIELKNIGAQAVNLNLVQFTSGITHTFGDVSVPVGGFLILVKNLSLFNSAYPDLPVGTTVIQWAEGSLDNSGEKITIKDALGRTIQSFSYKDSWYPLTDGDGFSLSIYDPSGSDLTLWNQRSGWRTSTYTGGSPGADETGLAPGSIVINEVMSHSHGTAPDWIELYNTAGQDIDISGWFLSDRDNDDPNRMKYQVPDGTLLEANDYLVFVEDVTFGNPSALGCNIPFGLSEAGETVCLYSGQDGQITGYYQTEENFDASETDVTFGRYEKAQLSGGYDFTRMISPTQGIANSGPLIPDIVITEIHYNPAEGPACEFVELYNRSGSPVTLMSDVTTETSPGVFIAESIPWRLKGIGFEFPADTIIQAAERIIIARYPGSYSSVTCDVYGPCDGALDNSGEQIEIQIAGDQEYGRARYWIPIEKVDYDNTAPWPTSADGGGHSLHRINVNTYGRDYSNWQADSPSPGI